MRKSHFNFGGKFEFRSWLSYCSYMISVKYFNYSWKGFNVQFQLERICHMYAFTMYNLLLLLYTSKLHSVSKWEEQVPDQNDQNLRNILCVLFGAWLYIAHIIYKVFGLFVYEFSPPSNLVIDTGMICRNCSRWRTTTINQTSMMCMCASKVIHTSMRVRMCEYLCLCMAQ